MIVKNEESKREPILFRHLKLGDVFSPITGEYHTKRHIKTDVEAAIYYECHKKEWTHVDVPTITKVRAYPDAFIATGSGVNWLNN